MGSILASLLNSAQSMRMFQRGMDVVQNNVANANTPGYAKQRLELVADGFDPEMGLSGGVSSPGLLDSRDAYADQNVRQQMSQQGASDKRVALLQQLQPLLQISDGAGIPGALNTMFQAFSALTVSPNDANSRQQALTAAGGVATSFQQAASSLGGLVSSTDQDLESTVAKLNSIGSQLQTLNEQFQSDYRAQTDPGLSAQLENLLEQLSQISDANVVREADGSVSIYLGGQALFLVENQLHPLTADTSGSTARLLDSSGNDITSALSGGSLAALIGFRNQTLPGVQSSLDTLAQSVADSVNTTLAGGVDENGQTPQTSLFTYDATTSPAQTLAVNPLTPDQLALALPSAPGGNGNALALAKLDQATAVNGLTFQDYYGNTAAQVGSDLSAEQNNLTTQNDMVNQAQSWRDSISKVDLNEEAANLMQYQTAYQAAAEMVTTLNTMMQSVLNMLQ